MSGATRAARLDEANRVLRTFARQDVLLDLEATGHVVACWTSITARAPGSISRRKRWMTRGNDFYPVWSHRAPWGGTQSTAISQLVRWVQGNPVLPLSTWEYWAGEGIKLGTADTLAVLREIGWPEVATCVLCGNPAAGLDWWSLDGVSGPCCSAWSTKACRFVNGRSAEATR